MQGIGVRACRWAFSLVAIMTGLFLTAAASFAAVVTTNDDGTIATGIQGLQIGSDFYNVTWASDPSYVAAVDRAAATSAIIAALNAVQPRPSTVLYAANFAINRFSVVTTGGSFGVVFSGGTEWTQLGTSSYTERARFDLVVQPVPLPASGLLLGGLLGLGLIALRRSAAA